MAAQAKAAGRRVDTDALLARVDLFEVVSAYVDLKRDGHEYKGCCPFHAEKTASFYVSPIKGFVHCFGCGAHHDAIGFLMAIDGIEFVEACKRLGADTFTAGEGTRRSAPVQVAPPEGVWVPLLPVPGDAPELFEASGWTRPIWNPKRGKFSRFKPAMTFTYRGANGELLGYVLRCEFDDGKKFTPQVTWCVGPDGAKLWCLTFFPAPRPLFGLERLAARPDAPVLLVEGEKCALAGAGALPMYACVAWPGGSKAVPYVDFSPLSGRDVVMWPDADASGVEAMLGHTNLAGEQRPGAAQYLHRVGVRALRMVDTRGQPKGWDIADAIRDGWTGRQIAAWAAHRVVDVNVRSQG
jgi:hypothetical protein